MADNPKLLKSIFTAAIAVTIPFIAITSAQAQSAILSPEAKEKGNWIGDIILKEDLVTETVSSLANLQLEDNVSQDTIRSLMLHAHGVITGSNNFTPADVTKAYKEAVSKNGTARDIATYNLYDLYLNSVYSSQAQEEDVSRLTTALEKATNNKDWVIANRAWLLLAQLNSRGDEMNFSLALEQAQNAYKIIPNEISAYVDDAKILTLVQTTFLHNVMLNTELAIGGTAEVIKLKRSANYPIDGSSLLNNLIYSLSAWREYEVSTKLAKDALEIEGKHGANVPGLTELRVGRLLNNQGKFSEALELISDGLSTVEHGTVRKNLSFSKVIALAGVGKITLAEKELEALTKNLSEANFEASKTQIIAAKASIAIAKGDRSEAFRLTTAVNDATIQELLTKYNSNTSKLLANLENSKDRQAEREAALQREANLKQEQLEQQKRINRLLMVLSGLFGIAALLAVAFARFRDKISKALELKTREAESADRMKSEFLGMVSHELRTPLNGIVGIADLLAMQAPSDDLRHKAGIILDSSNKLTHVIESIVDMSSIDGNKLELYAEPTDIQSVVMELDQLWRSTLEDKGITFTSFVDDSLSNDIIIDQVRFRQCIDNLLSNAVKFTESGRVHLHVTSEFISETDQTEITAIIADTGQGMSEEVQQKLFTPFLQADSTMTRKHGGSGLGLAITRSLARMMEGDVTMISKLGRGSEFTLTVRGKKSEAAQILDDVEAFIDEVDMTPISTQAAAHNELVHDIMNFPDEPKNITVNTAQEIATPQTLGKAASEDYYKTSTDDLRGLKILIVEDNPANQDVIKLFLNPEGCKSQCVTNGIEALDVLETQAIDIILMDIRMPDMDGIQTTQAIRNSGQDYKNTPIIALTADASPETNANCMAAGADIFLSKPVMARELIESIKFIRRDQDNDKAVSAA